MANGTTMAKDRKARGGPDPDEMVTRALKMRHEYADWLERFASRECRTVASVIAWALAKTAEQSGFEPPPDRVK